MPMHRGFRGDPQWWPEGEHWPPRGGRGYETWATFGRRLFVGFALFLGGLVVLAVTAGAVIATSIAGVTSSNRVGVVLTTVILLAAVGWFIWFVARRTWRPVKDLIGATGRLADGDYGARVDVRSSPTMRAVGSSFNSMAERLEEADEQRRRLMSDLGHELRTPLAVIRGEVEAVVDGVRDGGPEQMASLLDEVEVLERLVEDLRILTLSEAGRLPLEMELTDMAALVSDVADSYSSAATAAGVRISVEAPPTPSTVEMDPVRIRQALANLVVNSLRAMPGGGSLTLEVSAYGDRIVVAVADTGVGIDPDELPVVFDRFVKSEDSPGSGLGLSIARGLVRSHGGDLQIPTSGPGGTTATLWLPR